MLCQNCRQLGNNIENVIEWPLSIWRAIYTYNSSSSNFILGLLAVVEEKKVRNYLVLDIRWQAWRIDHLGYWTRLDSSWQCHVVQLFGRIRSCNYSDWDASCHYSGSVLCYHDRALLCCVDLGLHVNINHCSDTARLALLICWKQRTPFLNMLTLHVA